MDRPLYQKHFSTTFVQGLIYLFPFCLEFKQIVTLQVKSHFEILVCLVC
jgi:hypothetical protein